MKVLGQVFNETSCYEETRGKLRKEKRNEDVLRVKNELVGSEERAILL